MKGIFATASHPLHRARVALHALNKSLPPNPLKPTAQAAADLDQRQALEVRIGRAQAEALLVEIAVRSQVLRWLIVVVDGLQALLRRQWSVAEVHEANAHLSREVAEHRVDDVLVEEVEIEPAQGVEERTDEADGGHHYRLNRHSNKRLPLQTKHRRLRQYKWPFTDNRLNRIERRQGHSQLSGRGPAPFRANQVSR